MQAFFAGDKVFYSQSALAFCYLSTMVIFDIHPFGGEK